jgi:hypothetical protein
VILRADDQNIMRSDSNFSRPVTKVALGSTPAGRISLPQRLSLSAILPLRRGNGRSRAGGPEIALKRTVILEGSKGNP